MLRRYNNNVQYLEPCRDGQYAAAARFLDMPSAMEQRGPELARRLKAVFDRHSGSTWRPSPTALEVTAPTASLRISRTGSESRARWGLPIRSE